MRLTDRVDTKCAVKTGAMLAVWLMVASMLSGCVVSESPKMGGGGMSWFIWPGWIGLVLVVVLILVLVRRR